MPVRTRRSKAAEKSSVEASSTLVDITAEDGNAAHNAIASDHSLRVTKSQKEEQVGKENIEPGDDNGSKDSKVATPPTTPSSSSVKPRSKIVLVNERTGKDESEFNKTADRSPEAIVDSREEPHRAEDAKEKRRESKRKRAGVEEKLPETIRKMDWKKAKIAEQLKDMPDVAESSMRSSPNEKRPFGTLDDLLAREEPPPVERRVLRSGRAQRCPPIDNAAREREEPRTLADIRPTPRTQLVPKSAKKGKMAEVKDPRAYCRVISPRFLDCVLCEVDFDLDTLGQPDYDTEAYDKHAKSRVHSRKVAEIGTAGQPPIKTSVPESKVLETFGRVKKGSESGTKLKESSRKKRIESKVALQKVFDHEFCLVIEEALVQCRLCKVDVSFEIPLNTKTDEWDDHLLTNVHKKNEEAYRRG